MKLSWRMSNSTLNITSLYGLQVLLLYKYYLVYPEYISQHDAALYAHKRDPCKLLRSSSSPFIVNIAVIDFLTSCGFLANAFLYVSFYGGFILAGKRLGLLHIALTFLETISVTSVLSLSVERLFSVAFPLWHPVKMTTRVTRYWLAAVWLFHSMYEGFL